MEKIESFLFAGPEFDSDDEHGRDGGAEHGEEETTWTVDPVVENREKLGMVVTAAVCSRIEPMMEEES